MKVLYFGPIHNVKIWSVFAERIFPDLIEPLSKEHDIVLVLPNSPETRDIGSTLNDIGVTVEFLSEPPCKTAKLTPARVSRFKQSFNTIVTNHSPEVITNIFGGATVIGEIILDAAEKHNAKSVLRCAGDDLGINMMRPGFIDSGKYWPFHLKQASNFYRAKRLIVMSQLEYHRVNKICGNSKKIHICKRGVDLQFLGSEAVYRKEKYTRFLYLGRNSYEKGYDLIEQAAQYLYHKNNDIEFFFAGNFPKKKSGNIHYIGTVQHKLIADVLNDIDVLLLPSRSEGFPQTLMEAMAAGKPCIISRHLFDKEFTGEKEVLFCETTSDDLIRQIEHLYENPELGFHLAVNAREYAISNYDYNVLKHDYLQAVTMW